MSLFRFRDAADALDDLLENERAAILGGKYDVLGRLVKEKERLMVAVSTPAMAPRLGQIKQKAERNRALLDAAAKAFRAVSERIANHAQRSESFRTYDQSGQRHGHSSSGKKLERRA